MKRLIAVSAFIFATLMAFVIINGNNSIADSGMTGAGGFQGADATRFGKGKEAIFCPVSGEEIKSGQRVEVVLPNGKKMVMCCQDCRATVEKEMDKYEVFLY